MWRSLGWLTGGLKLGSKHLNVPSVSGLLRDFFCLAWSSWHYKRTSRFAKSTEQYCYPRSISSFQKTLSASDGHARTHKLLTVVNHTHHACTASPCFHAEVAVIDALWQELEWLFSRNFWLHQFVSKNLFLFLLFLKLDYMHPKLSQRQLSGLHFSIGRGPG